MVNENGGISDAFKVDYTLEQAFDHDASRKIL